MLVFYEKTQSTNCTHITWRMMGLMFVTLTTIFTASDACFIRNCPLGGKRSAGSYSSGWVNKRQCMSCGPQGLGKCIGPNICCGPDIGCYMSTVETKACAMENENPIPCEINGRACGTESDGRCVTDGICCTDEKCILDAVCDEREPSASHDYTGSSNDVKQFFSKQPLSEYLIPSNARDLKSNEDQATSLYLTPRLESYINRLLQIRDYKRK